MSNKNKLSDSMQLSLFDVLGLAGNIDGKYTSSEIEEVKLFSVIELEFAQLVLFLHGLYLLCYFASLNQI